jgi:hypothetical protein
MLRRSSSLVTDVGGAQAACDLDAQRGLLRNEDHASRVVQVSSGPDERPHPRQYGMDGLRGRWPFLLTGPSVDAARRRELCLVVRWAMPVSVVSAFACSRTAWSK